jgi:hypothetical protein
MTQRQPENPNAEFGSPTQWPQQQSHRGLQQNQAPPSLPAPLHVNVSDPSNATQNAQALRALLTQDDVTMRDQILSPHQGIQFNKKLQFQRPNGMGSPFYHNPVQYTVAQQQPVNPVGFGRPQQQPHQGFQFGNQNQNATSSLQNQPAVAPVATPTVQSPTPTNGTAPTSTIFPQPTTIVTSALGLGTLGKPVKEKELEYPEDVISSITRGVPVTNDNKVVMLALAILKIWKFNFSCI